MHLTYALIYNKVSLHNTLTIGNVTIMCNQTGRIQTVKASLLSSESGTLTEDDLRVGAQLFLQVGMHTYPITVVPNISGRKPVKRKLEEDVREYSNKRAYSCESEEEDEVTESEDEEELAKQEQERERQKGKQKRSGEKRKEEEQHSVLELAKSQVLINL